MRIVDRKTFLSMPNGTVYCKFDPAIFRDMAVKEGVIGESSDFLYQDLTPAQFEGDRGSEDHFDTLLAMQESGKSAALEFNCTSRDGLFDADQLFAVFERQDVERLIACLQEALAEGYPTGPE